METRVSSATREILITDEGSTVLIGERINPSGKKKLAEALRRGDFDVVRKEAVAQVEAGADILDINVVCPGVDEIAVLPKIVQKVMASVDAPLCIDINNPVALKEALKVYEGKPIVNSVTGEENSLNEILPLVKEYGAAVIGLTIDEEGIPKESDRRVAIAHKIIERAESLEIPPEDVIIDCLALTLGADSNAGLVTLETIGKVKEELGVNQTLGASNISFGLPARSWINRALLTLAIAAGLDSAILDPLDQELMAALLAAELVLGQDSHCLNYIRTYRAGALGKQNGGG